MDTSKLIRLVQEIRQDVDVVPEGRPRELMGRVLNLVETVVAEATRVAEENERLREFLRKAHVKLPPPSSSPSAEVKSQEPTNGKTPASPSSESDTTIAAGAASASDRSSEKERRAREKPKPKRHPDYRSFRPISIDRTVLCPVDPARLPSDAIFLGCEETRVQDLLIRTDNVLYRAEVWQSPSQGRLVGELPAGVQGEFGPQLRALLVSLKYVAGTSLPRAQELVEHLGILISSASVVKILHAAAEPLKAEKEALFRAALAATTYQHIDDTRARVGGASWHTHVIGSPLHASYFTRPNKDRLTVLDLLRTGPRTYRFDTLTQELLQRFHVPKKWRRRAARLPQRRDLTEAELTPLLDAWQPAPPASCLANLREAAALASYRARPDHVGTLVGDGAKQFRHVADHFQACWVHEGRHYKEIAPVVPQHQEQLERFRSDFWDYYGALQKYRAAPTPLRAEQLRTEFDELFSRRTGYDALDARIARTQRRKAELLTVLEHPEVPPHNNPAESDERTPARRRDVSLHCRHAAGADEMDTFTTIVVTAKKLAINAYQYLCDRISGAMRLPSLASLITQRAAGNPLPNPRPPTVPSQSSETPQQLLAI